MQAITQRGQVCQTQAPTSYHLNHMIIHSAPTIASSCYSTALFSYIPQYLHADMNFSVISQYAFTEDSADGRMKTIAWLQARRLLASIMICNLCYSNMTLVNRERQATAQDDKWAWRCPRCNSIKSIRSGSWFEGEDIDEFNWLT